MGVRNRNFVLLLTVFLSLLGAVESSAHAHPLDETVSGDCAACVLGSSPVEAATPVDAVERPRSAHSRPVFPSQVDPFDVASGACSSRAPPSL